MSRAKDTELASQLSGEPTKVTRTRELPAALAGTLADFVNDQKRDMAENRHQYLSPEERQRIEKAKLQVKQHFLKFFRHHSVKKNKQYFIKWKAFVEFEQHREAEYERVRKGLLKRSRYKKKLKGDKDKQDSHILLNGFKALNQNELKDGAEDGGDVG